MKWLFSRGVLAPAGADNDTRKQEEIINRCDARVAIVTEGDDLAAGDFALINAITRELED